MYGIHGLWVSKLDNTPSAPFKITQLTPSTQKIAGQHRQEDWPNPCRCPWQDLRGRRRGLALSLQRAQDPASRHQAVQHPRQFARADQAVRLWRVGRAHQLDRKHLCRHVHLHGARADKGRPVLGQVRRLESGPVVARAGHWPVSVRYRRLQRGHARQCRSHGHPGSPAEDCQRARPAAAQECRLPAELGADD